MDTPPPQPPPSLPSNPPIPLSPASPTSPPRPSRISITDYATPAKVKFVLIGSNGVGKTNVASRFCRNKFEKDSGQTVGFEFGSRVLKVAPRLSITAQIWDTAGQERYNSLTGQYLKGAVGIILVYDIGNRKSFEAIERWMKKVDQHAHPNAVRTLVGNKLDDPASRQVPTLTALNFAKHHEMDFCEVSAKSGLNVEVALRRLIVSVAFSLAEEDDFRLSVERNSSSLFNSSRPPFMPELDDSPPIFPSSTSSSSVPLTLPNPLPRGWVSVDSMYENVWTGERVADRPKEVAGQGKITYGRSREELEKIDVRFAGIDMSASRKGRRGGKGNKGNSRGGGDNRQISKDGISFGLHGRKSNRSATCGACSIS
mmetsp:Transcript_16355/g.33659  ORF Transcript_16355/g.33659 Transcript_16355/m.33659 type:complete len:370 (-) Transcript_16355:7-1116(-)